MDSDGDGVGDIRGITSKLQHLQDAGIGATWMSPIFRSPMVDFGYDISDYMAIQPEYGTMEDFDGMMQEANRLGIRIVLDFVPNHSSDQCEWFLRSVSREPEYEDFYVWHDGRENPKGGDPLPPNNWVDLVFVLLYGGVSQLRLVQISAIGFLRFGLDVSSTAGAVLSASVHERAAGSELSESGRGATDGRGDAVLAR